MKSLLWLVYTAVAIAAAAGFAETVKDREGAVREDKAAMEDDPRWIYNDYRKGFEEAKRTGKPLLVVLRCVPCLSCAGIDAGVLTEPGLVPLLDQFVCVRLINANAIDLRMFQFDYDLSFSTLFFNADGTLYGRYGSWRHQKDAHDKTTEGYKLALEGALALHEAYPANKAALLGKQGGPTPYRSPLELPGILGKYSEELNWSGKVVQSCVHCHQIGDAFRLSYRDKKQPIPNRWIYAWPTPEIIGLGLAADQAAHVQSVLPESIAAQAGILAGDDIISLDGQSLISIADVSWALHRAPESGSLTAVVKRAGAVRSVTLQLPANWRTKADISRRVGTWPMRGMATGGLVLEDLDDTERSKRGLDRDGMALWVKGVGQYGKHGAAKRAGFEKEDVIVQIDGLTARLTEGELIGRLLQTRQAGEQVKTRVLRGSDRIELTLPMQ